MGHQADAASTRDQAQLQLVVVRLDPYLEGQVQSRERTPKLRACRTAVGIQDPLEALKVLSR